MKIPATPMPCRPASRRPLHLLTIGPLLAITAAAAAQTTPPADPPPPDDSRPKYDLALRQNEDWTSMTPSGRPFDGLKNIALSEDGEVRLSFGGSARLRMESWNNFGAREGRDDTFLLSRLRLHSDLRIGESFRVFAEGKSAFVTDRDLPGGRRTLDVDSLEIQQAFVDVRASLGDDAEILIRPGRQMLRFGRQRLVSPLPWANTMRAWDGVTAEIRASGWTITPFWTRFAAVQKYDFNESDDGAEFFGVYATGPVAGKSLSMDVYLLGLDRDDTVTFNGTAGDEQRYTAGARFFGEITDGLSYDLEGAFQFGSVGSEDIAAGMLAAELRYALPDNAYGAQVFAGFDYASGDDEAGGDVETFGQLFPLGHAYFGAIDAIGRQNLIATNLGVQFKPVERLTVVAQGHLFWRASDEDAVYNAGGGVFIPGAASDESFVGGEIDLKATYKVSPQMSVQGGYSHFFAGDVVEDGVANDGDTDFFYLQLQLLF